jgi:hypothetical protein
MLRCVHLIAVAALIAAACAGCGTTKQAEATQQLLSSDAVDRAVAMIDFSPLEGQKVYFDAKYLLDYKGIGFVNSNYVISSLRQQMFAAGCQLQEKPENADYVVEARIGTLGNDEHNIVYGIPANNGLNAAAVVVPNSPPLPAIPEISFARRDDLMGASKIAAFAYHRETQSVVWQSGLSVARSTAKDTWILGAGPFERGTIHDGWSFAGTRLKLPFLRRKPPDPAPIASYKQQLLFDRPAAADPEPAQTDVAEAAQTPPAADAPAAPSSAVVQQQPAGQATVAPADPPGVAQAATIDEQGDKAPENPDIRQTSGEWWQEETRQGGGG